MKVYIQQSTSNYLYSANHGWVKNVLEADTFETSIDALNYCIQRNLANVQIRVHPGDTDYDTIFSVTDFPNRTKAPVLE